MTTLLGVVCGIGVAAGILLAIAGVRPYMPTVKPDRAARPKLTGTRLRLTRAEQLRVAVALTAGILLAVIAGWFIAIVILPLIAVGLPRLMRAPVGVDPDRLDALGDWVRALHGLIVVGTPLGSAIIATERSVPKAIAEPVHALIARLRAEQPIDDALYTFADELSDQTGDFIASALIQASRVSNAGLTRTLEAIANDVTEEVAARRDIIVQRHGSLTQARWMTIGFSFALPAYVLFSPTATAYRTPLGQLVLIGFAASYAAALLWLRRTATTKPPKRFLKRPAELAVPTR